MNNRPDAETDLLAFSCLGGEKLDSFELRSSRLLKKPAKPPLPNGRGSVTACELSLYHLTNAAVFTAVSFPEDCAEGAAPCFRNASVLTTPKTMEENL